MARDAVRRRANDHPTSPQVATTTTARRWSRWLPAGMVMCALLTVVTWTGPAAADRRVSEDDLVAAALQTIRSGDKRAAVPRALQRRATAAVAAAEHGWRAASVPGALTEMLPPSDVTADGHVVMIATATPRAALREALGADGSVQRDLGRDRYRIVVEPTSIERVAGHPAVANLEQRVGWRPDAIVSEGAVWMNAASRHDQGLRGAVDVAIVDGGFAGWAAAQQAGELPAPASEMSYCDNIGFRSDQHGTAVAEIIHDMAPAARLHAICIEDASDFVLASRYIRSKGITIVNSSGGFLGTGFGNGKEGGDSPWHVVNGDRQAGIFWTVSAGNTGDEHWGGLYVDTDGDDVHEFGPDALNSATVPAGGAFQVTLRWDEYDAARTDMDLFVFDEYGNLIGQSVAPQLEGYGPVESVWLRNGASDARTIHIGVGRYAGSHVPEMDLFVQGTTPPRYRTRNRSVAEPATSPGAFAVGAVCAANGQLQPYSGAGPTADGRTKPDIVSFDAVSGFTYGSSQSTCQHGFPGTSAAAPHVAGAAALVKAANPAWGPAKIAEYLRANAADIGSPGPDNGTGWGHLRLGAIASTGSSYDPSGPAGTIYRLYRAYFLREPDRAGFDYWLGVYGNGYPLNKISDDFARSSEFQVRYGSLDNEGFLKRVYQNVLGRNPDTTGWSYWMDQMNRGMPRGDVMIYFSDSAEFRSKTADGRPPGY